MHSVRHVVALTAPVPFVALRHFPTPWGIATVLKTLIVLQILQALCFTRGLFFIFKQAILFDFWVRYNYNRYVNRDVLRLHIICNFLGGINYEFHHSKIL